MKVNLVFGPPGTGKTTELMSILEEELKTLTPQEIAYVTFTKEGAEQGIRRATDAFPYNREDFIYFRTLHSLAFRQLKLARSDVISKMHYREFSSFVGMNFSGHYTEEIQTKDDEYLFFDELYRNNEKEAEAYMAQLDMSKVTFVRRNYKSYKEKLHIKDFTDMVEDFCERNIPVPVKVAFIDEAQDLTTLQWRMVLIAFRDCERIYIAGDDDQAVYQWSGADVNYFLSIVGEVKILQHSYRLPDSVLKFSKHITDQIGKRVVKEYNGKGEKGAVKYVNDISELTFDDTSTYMLLARNNAYLSNYEFLLQQYGLNYFLKEDKAVKKKELETIKLYEESRRAHGMTPYMNNVLAPSLKTRYNLANPWYDSFNWSLDKCNYIREMLSNGAFEEHPRIRVSTIHAVKGGEADHVVLMLDMARKTFSSFQANPDPEHRVFYVGATRAKKTLTIVYSTTKHAYPLYL